MTFSNIRPEHQSKKVNLVKRLNPWLAILFMALVSGTASASSFLKDFNGSMHSLDEYTGNGKWAVVMIWASDCSACNQEVGEYIKFNSKHKDDNAFILGISTDGHKKKTDAVNFIKRHKVDFHNLIDEPEKIASIYKNLTGQPFVGTPSFLVFSPTGELRAAQVGAVPTNIIESFIAKETAASAKL